MQNENLRLSGSDKSDVTKFEGKSPTPRCVSPFHQLTSLQEKNKLSRLSWSLMFFKQKGLVAYTWFFSWTDSGIWEHWRLKCSIINAASVRKGKFSQTFNKLNTNLSRSPAKAPQDFHRIRKATCILQISAISKAFYTWKNNEVFGISQEWLWPMYNISLIQKSITNLSFSNNIPVIKNGDNLSCFERKLIVFNCFKIVQRSHLFRLDLSEKKVTCQDTRSLLSGDGKLYDLRT